MNINHTGIYIGRIIALGLAIGIGVLAWPML